MIPARECNLSFGTFAEANARVAPFVRQLLSLHGKSHEIPLETCFGISDTQIAFVEKGSVCLEIEERSVCWFAKDEIVGPWFGTGNTSRLRTGSEPVTVILIPAEKFYDHITTSAQFSESWSRYLIEAARALSLLYSLHGALRNTLVPSVVQFQPGQPIMIEGSSGEFVFSLLEGRADVLVSGNKVGEIPLDHIFGAPAALTGEARSASIVATEPCTALRFDRITFKEMLNSHPDLVTKLVEDMAQVIRDQNQKLLEVRKDYH